MYATSDALMQLTEG